MKKIVVLIVCLLFFSLFVSVFILATGNQLDSNENQKNSAFIIWGTRDYSDENYMGGEPELASSRDVCSDIYDFLADSQQFAYCENYWGNGTQPDQVYSNVSSCEKNYDFTAVYIRDIV